MPWSSSPPGDQSITQSEPPEYEITGLVAQKSSNDRLGIGQVIKKKIRIVGREFGARIVSRGDGDGFCSNPLPAFDVTRCVSNDKNAFWRKLFPVRFQRASAGEFRELIAIVVIVCKSAKIEIVPDSIVAQLDLRPANKVPRQECQDAIFSLPQPIQQTDDSRKHVACVKREPLPEKGEIAIQQRRN